MKYFVLFFILLYLSSEKKAISQDSIVFANYQMIFRYHPQKPSIDSLINVQINKYDSIYKKLKRDYDSYGKSSQMTNQFDRDDNIDNIILSLVQFPTYSKKKIATFKDSIYNSLKSIIIDEVNTYAKENNFKYIINSEEKYILYIPPKLNHTYKILNWIYKNYNKH